MSGWIKLYRDFNEWEWRDSPKHVSVFLDLLIQANHKDRKYRGEMVKRGSLTTSRTAISQRTKVSEQSVRTILKDLKSTGEITIETNNKCSMISIIKYDKYQSKDDDVTSQLTINQPSTNHQSTTNKNVKNVKKERNTKPSFDFEALYKKYPKKQGKSLGLKKLAKIIKTQKQYDDFEKAVNNLKIVCKDRLPKHMPHFSTFVNSLWEDYVDDEVLQDTTEYQEKKTEEEISNFFDSALKTDTNTIKTRGF